MTIGYAAGAFDLFHIGHLNILRESKARCDVLIAGVVCDELVQATKGYRPVISTWERAEIVANISFVDDVFIETDADRLNTWRAVQFDVFFKGDDWQGTDKGRELERRFAAVGVQVEYLPYTLHTSSTQLRLALESLTASAVSVSKA